MKFGFTDPMFETWAQRALLNVPGGGAEVGEVAAMVGRIPDGDRGAWFAAWTALADKLSDQAGQCLRQGHRASARQLFQRASTYYRLSYPLLFGRPTDARVVQGYQREAQAFAQAAALFSEPVQAVEIPYESTTLPGYFYSGGPGTRPLVVCTNGYDETLHAMHYAHAVAAQQRGYHVLVFDGPGQGRALIEQGLTMRPDWEAVVQQVVDYAVALPGVDALRIALVGWSFGGYLAPRAAAGEPRIAALIADPGQWDMLDAVRGMFSKMGAGELARALPQATESDLQPVVQAIQANPALRWTVMQRGYWVHGVDSFSGYVQALAQFRLSHLAGQIACPTLLTWAKDDPIAAFAPVLYESLNCPKTLITFSADEGTGGHCETLARSVYHQRAYDWLGQVFNHPG